MSIFVPQKLDLSSKMIVILKITAWKQKWYIINRLNEAAKPPRPLQKKPKPKNRNYVIHMPPLSPMFPIFPFFVFFVWSPACTCLKRWHSHLPPGSTSVRQAHPWLICCSAAVCLPWLTSYSLTDHPACLCGSARLLIVIPRVTSLLPSPVSLSHSFKVLRPFSCPSRSPLISHTGFRPQPPCHQNDSFHPTTLSHSNNQRITVFNFCYPGVHSTCIQELYNFI